MKLLYIVQYFSFPEGPTGTRPYDLATSFAKQGVDVTVLTTDASGTAKKKWTLIERDGIKVYRLNNAYDNNMGFLQRIASFCKFFFNASIKQFSFDYDIMLSSSTPLTNGIPALVAHSFRHKPYIFEVRDVWPGVPIAMGYFRNKISQKILYAFEKRIYKKASAIVPLSVGMDNDIKERYPNEKSAVIPNISELNRFTNVKKSVDIDFPYDKKIVLYAGAFGKVNGLGYVLDLAKYTVKKDPSLWFYLIGMGKEKEALVKKADSLGLNNVNVFFFDPVQKNDLPYIYSKCTAGSSYVIDLPVLWNNSANKFFDTLAAKKPIIINHKGWQAEEIEKYNMGYVLPPVITEEEADKFVAYMNNIELLEQQGTNAYGQAEKEYSLEVAVDKYMMIFKTIKG